MKKTLLLLIIIGITGCSDGKVVEPDTPVNAAFLMKHRIGNQSYAAFQQLFYDETKNTISREEFKELRKMTSAGTNYREHMLLTFDNGEMLLVEFAPRQKEDEHYKIVNVKPVPEEVKAFFQSQ